MVSLASRSRIRDVGPPGAGVDLDGSPSHKAAIERYLSSLSFSENPRLAKLVGLMRDSLSVGGTRIRPLLCMEVAGACGLDPTDVLPAATAIELIHTGSLVHGRLLVMCDDPGVPEPSYATVCDDATVILAGDAFFSEALALISHHQKGEPERLVEVIRELAGATGARGVIGGQTLTEELDKRVPDREMLNAAHSYGTGSLIAASARIGAILGGATEEEKGLLARYARHVGLCMRASADVLKAGFASDGLALGVGGEENRHEASFVQVYGLRGAQQLAIEALRGALEVLSSFERDTRGLAEVARFAHAGSDRRSSA